MFEILKKEENQTSCKMCGRCCKSYPCALLPKDLPKIAKFLGLTEQKLFSKYLIIDYYCNGGDELPYITPARKDGFTGKKVSFSWAFSGSPCIFLTHDNKCSIHDVKPHGGKTIQCWTSRRCNDKKWYAEKWKNHPYLDKKRR